MCGRSRVSWPRARRVCAPRPALTERTSPPQAVRKQGRGGLHGLPAAAVPVHQRHDARRVGAGRPGQGRHGPRGAGGAGDSQPDAMRGWSARSGFGFRSQRAAPAAGARAARLALPALTTCARGLGPGRAGGRSAPSGELRVSRRGRLGPPALCGSLLPSRPPTGRCSPWPPSSRFLF